jgi:hypothetical protein
VKNKERINMKKQFSDYITAIGLTESLVKRVETIYDFYANLLKIDIEDIFVTDFIDKEGVRHYQNLWFFSKNYWMEAKGFVSSDNFDSMNIVSVIVYWVIEKTEYDFVKATEKSRLSINVHPSVFELPSTDFKASRENCDFLRDLFLKHIISRSSK